MKQKPKKPGDLYNEYQAKKKSATKSVMPKGKVVSTAIKGLI